jgi:hypothetical protein
MNKALLSIVLLPVTLAVAQTNDDEPTEPIEEIIVYGEKSLLRYRYEMEAVLNDVSAGDDSNWKAYRMKNREGWNLA